MNQLELRLSPHIVDGDSNSYLVIEVQIDGIPVVNFDGFATDLHEFERSLKGSGDFYIITCWCGDPGCAGVTEPVHVQHEGPVVHWRMASPGPARSFVFARDKYVAVLAEVVSQGKGLIDSLRQSSERTLQITPNWSATFFLNVVVGTS